MARLVPVRHEPRRLFGSMKGTVTVLGDIVGPLDEPWEALEDDDLPAIVRKTKPGEQR